MANKITEIITEPNKIYVGSTFKLKIKAIRYATYNELKTKTYKKNLICFLQNNSIKWKNHE